MTTIIIRIVEDGRPGLRGSAEIPGGPQRTFVTDDQLLDALYEWVEDGGDSGNGSGSISSSAIRAT